MREKRLGSVVLSVALCIVLAMPLLVTTIDSTQASGIQIEDTFNTSGVKYPTADGKPLFTLHICVAEESWIQIEAGEIIKESLRDIGIEGVVHPLSWFPIYLGLYPEYSGLDQYGFERPCPAGAPSLVTVIDPQPTHFHHTQYYDRGVMWCGTDDSNLATPPGYGNNWDDQLTKSFQLPTGSVSMSFAVQWDCEWGWDVLLVEISQDGGDTYEALLQLSGVSDWYTDPDLLYEYMAELQQAFPSLINIQSPDELGFAVVQTDLTAYAKDSVDVRFRFVSDVSVSDQDGLWDSNGACRIDWVEVTGYARDEFSTGDDGWTAASSPLEITVMQGYDIAFHGVNFDEAYRSWIGFSRGHSNSTNNQGYFNPEFDALYDELESLKIDWNKNFPDPPKLNSRAGRRALEILQQLQAIWAEDQPCLVLFNRMLWVDGGGTGFPISPWNFNNEHLAKCEVRQAINLALRRQEIMNLYDYQPPWEAYALQTWLAPWHPGFNSTFLPVYDINLARQILYDAGYTRIFDKKPLTLESTVEFMANTNLRDISGKLDKSME